MERVSVLCLLLLCSLSPAEGQDKEIIEQREARPESGNMPEQPQPCLSDIHAVLREMSVKLAVLQVQMELMQKENQEQDTKLRQVDMLNQQLQEQAAKLRDLVKQTTEVDALKLQLQGHAVKLTEVETLKQQQQAQKADLTNIKMQANVTENYVESLWRDRAVGHVAFSASLLTSGNEFIGPFNTDIPLVFRHVISNFGNAYNSNTGFFIAPVRGAYHFEFHIGSWSDDYHNTAVDLVKNGGRVVRCHERGPNGHSSAANGATLLLEPGDVVYLRLLSTHRIYDNTAHFTSFSGHLLFLV